jgi:hypothetical protein
VNSSPHRASSSRATPSTPASGTCRSFRAQYLDRSRVANRHDLNAVRLAFLAVLEPRKQAVPLERFTSLLYISLRLWK